LRLRSACVARAVACGAHAMPWYWWLTHGHTHIQSNSDDETMATL
jgi:hypothetical protein